LAARMTRMAISPRFAIRILVKSVMGGLLARVRERFDNRDAAMRRKGGNIKARSRGATGPRGFVRVTVF
jgi:hypothetical protein